jgi:mannose-1-phosphate guanylyltransferase
MPKPFMRLADGISLLQKTFLRASTLPGVERVLTVTNREVVFRTQDEYRQVDSQRVALDFILEPFGRNTAPAIAAAALHCARVHGEDSVLLVLPADHLIEDRTPSPRPSKARQLASQGWLTTFGLQPTRAETGFGYIEQGQPLSGGAYQVERFVESPTPRPPRPTCKAAVTCGTPACSACVSTPSCTSCSCTRRRFCKASPTAWPRASKARPACRWSSMRTASSG